MIKANELRIGNWVAIPECAIHVQVLGVCPEKYRIDNKNVDVDDCDVWFEPSSFEPIPITEKILISAGFIKNENGKLTISVLQENETDRKELIYGYNVMFLCEWDLENNEQDDLCTIWNRALCKEIYVHELQNLYFSLTKKELIIPLQSQ